MPGTNKTHRSYVWAYATTQFCETAAVVYDFSPSRAGEHASNSKEKQLTVFFAINLAVIIGSRVHLGSKKLVSSSRRSKRPIGMNFGREKSTQCELRHFGQMCAQGSEAIRWSRVKRVSSHDYFTFRTKNCFRGLSPRIAAFVMLRTMKYQFLRKIGARVSNLQKTSGYRREFGLNSFKFVESQDRGHADAETHKA